MSKLTKGQVTNDMIEYFSEHVGTEKIIGQTTDTVWNMFHDFCDEHRLKVICNKTAFGQRLSRITDLTTTPRKVNGKQIRVWVDVETRLKSAYISNDTIKQYVQETGIDEISGCLSSSIWEDFCEYCENNKIENRFSKLGFCQRLSKMYNLKSKCVRFYGKVCKILEA